jgi:signal transduction histidine kinase/CheY-like chemotaxis protein/HPt (histidine-containing phosphotransfer) domain-containing protein
LTDEDLALLSTTLPSRADRRLAVGVMVVSAAIFAALVPFAKVPLQPVAAFIPAYQSALVVNDLITAVLLFGQYRNLRSPAFLALATGYLFTAFMAAAHTLSFPGLFAPSGLLGSGPQTTAWLYMFWHGGFPCLVIIYALRKRQAGRGSGLASGWAMAGAFAAALVMAIGFTALATAGHEALPAIMRDQRYTPAMIGVVASVWTLSLAALLTIWRQRPHSVLDLWLMVVMCAWVFDIGLAAVFNAGRFDVGFYAGRVYGLLAATFVLIVLLVEIGRIYTRLAATSSAAHRKAADLERATVELERQAHERRVLIAELTQARADAEQGSRAKSAFLATMSHEIRTPMNGVIGMVEVLARSRLSDDQRSLVATIRESAATLLGIIDDILDFSKIEAGRLQIEKAPLLLPDLVEGISTSLVPVAVRQHVALDVFVSPQLPERVLSDDVRVRQVLYNLIGNAIKFSGGRADRPGRISIRADVAQAAPLRVVFSISDNGIGMTADTLRNLFTRFTQAEISTTRRFGGTGLGLTICKRLVELMQGEITVESSPGQGSTFTVTLPFDVPDEQPAPSLPHLQGVTCVLVSNPNLALDTLRTYLECAGVSVHVVDDAMAAAQRAAAWNEPVVVVVDETDASLPASLANAADVRAILVRRGRRSRARMQTGEALRLDADALARRTLLRTVAVAAGLASPDVVPAVPADIAPEDATEAPTVIEARDRGELILVAEDDKINRKVIMQQLSVLGFAAELAHNGAEALRLWREGRYALLLTDVHMPEMDGYALTEAIRREEQGERRMPILALTANALRGEANRAHAAGMDDYLTKPVQLHVLKATLEKWLPKASTPVPAVVETAARPRRATFVVDVRVLQGLVGNDPRTVRSFLSDYLDSARTLAAELRTAWAVNDAQKVGTIMHKLKSSSRSVGAIAFGDLCAELESAGKAGDVASIANGVAKFDPAFAEVEASIVVLLAASEGARRSA